MRVVLAVLVLAACHPPKVVPPGNPISVNPPGPDRSSNPARPFTPERVKSALAARA